MSSNCVVFVKVKVAARCSTGSWSPRVGLCVCVWVCVFAKFDQELQSAQVNVAVFKKKQCPVILGHCVTHAKLKSKFLSIALGTILNHRGIQSNV